MNGVAQDRAGAVKVVCLTAGVGPVSASRIAALHPVSAGVAYRRVAL
ncbi:hypothetical protein [Yoonia sp.]|nr:hypothetical protein [Yoonia sp.]